MDQEPNCPGCGRERVPPEGYAFAPPKPAPDAMRAQFTRQELGGALVCTILENENSIVDVSDHLNGTYALTIHSRSSERDQWDDLTATLKPQHFAKLGSVAAPVPSPDVAGEARLPCDVHLPPATYIRRGCTVATLMAGLRHRENFPDDMRVFSSPPFTGAAEPDAVRALIGSFARLQRRLMSYCNHANAGHMPSDAREFTRRILLGFQSAYEEANMTPPVIESETDAEYMAALAPTPDLSITQMERAAKACVHDAIAQMFYNEMPYCEDDVAHLGKPSWDSDQDSPLKARARLRADQVFELISTPAGRMTRETLKSCEEYLKGLVGNFGLSSYYPVHALIDKINAALSESENPKGRIDERCRALARKRRQGSKAKK